MKITAWALALIIILMGCSMTTPSTQEQAELVNLLEHQNANTYMFECKVKEFSPTMYHWDFGDGKEVDSASSKATYTFPYSGTYEVTCEATDGSHKASSTYTVHVSVPASTSLDETDQAVALSGRIAANTGNESKRVNLNNTTLFNDSDFEMLSYPPEPTTPPSRGFPRQQSSYDDWGMEDYEQADNTPPEQNTTNQTTNQTQAGPIINVNVNVTIISPVVPTNITVEIPSTNITNQTNITIPLHNTSLNSTTDNSTNGTSEDDFVGKKRSRQWKEEFDYKIGSFEEFS
jgi:hypothetical protein